MTRATSLNTIIQLGFFFILAVFCLPSVCHCLPANKVTKFSFEKNGPAETVTIYLQKPVNVNHFTLSHPDRIVVDLKDSFIPGVMVEQRTDGEIISRVRIGQNQKNITRVVADLNGRSPSSFTVEQTIIDGIPNVKLLTFPMPNNDSLAAIQPVLEPFERTAQKPPEIISSGTKKNHTDESEKSLSLFDEGVPDDIFSETAPPQTESDFSLSGVLNTRSTFQVQEDSAIENNYSFRNRVLIEGKYKHFVTLSALSDYLHFGSENKLEDYDLELHEAKWQYTGENIGFTIGKQIKRWGKTDQFSPIDTLNPEDVREFVIPEYEERKIPIWMADVNFFFDTFTLEGIYIPFFEKSKFHYFGTDWSVFGHIKQELQRTNLPDPLQSYFENIGVHETTPSNESEFAARLMTTIGTVDLGLTFHRTIEDFPYFKSFPVKNISLNGDFSGNNVISALNTAVLTDEKIEVEYKKTNIAGLEFETTIDHLGLRGEAVWEENRSLLTSSLVSNRYPVVNYIVGADYTTEKNTYLNLQLLYSRIIDYTPDILYFDQDSYSLLGEFKVDLVSDWLQAAIRYNVALNNDSAYLSPYFRYVYITNLECLFGAVLFSGDPDTYFGRFEENDVLFLNVYFHF